MRRGRDQDVGASLRIGRGICRIDASGGGDDRASARIGHRCHSLDQRCDLGWRELLRMDHVETGDGRGKRGICRRSNSARDATVVMSYFNS